MGMLSKINLYAVSESSSFLEGISSLLKRRDKWVLGDMKVKAVLKIQEERTVFMYAMQSENNAIEKISTKEKKIKALFVSAVPAIIAGIISLFSNDAFINLDAKKYSNTNEQFNIEAVDYDVIIYDDSYSCVNEILNINVSGKLFNKLNPKRIIYTEKNETGYLKNIIDSGAEGIVSKFSDEDKLREAIIRVAFGEIYYCENILNVLISSTQYGSILSPREGEVLCYLQEGLTYKDIAAKLFLSPKTILRHIEDMKKKLNVSTFEELLRLIKAKA